MYADPERQWRWRRSIAATLLAAIFLLAMPYCGALFNCGCTWPWQGLAEHCNFYDARSSLHCPWCEYPFAGVISLATAAFAGLAVSLRQNAGGFLVPLLSGIAAFLLVAATAGGLTALTTGYPRFL
jgi:hypothetical protein